MTPKWHGDARLDWSPLLPAEPKVDERRKGVEESMRFRVMIYNIHRAIGFDHRFRPDRMIRIIESHEPDVALLQEVDDGVSRSREMDLARELAATPERVARVECRL
jgi:hypothetical protein